MSRRFISAHIISSVVCVTTSRGSHRLSHLTVWRVDRSLGHVQHGAQGLDVVALPVPDGLGQDLQLQVLLLPHVLALGLERTAWSLRESAPPLAHAYRCCASYGEVLEGVHAGVQVGSVGVLVLRPGHEYKGRREFDETKCPALF